MNEVEIKLEALAASAAWTAYEAGEGEIPDTAKDIVEGAPFTIPVLLPLGLDSGDGRTLVKDAELDVRDLPIPVYWQPRTDDGHKGSYIVARIDSCDLTETGIVNARGVFDTGPYGREAERLVKNQFMRGVSADLDNFKVVDDPDELAAMAEDSEEDINEKLFIKKARVMGATLLGKPAFQECTIVLDANSEELPLVDGIYEAEIDIDDDEEAIVSALIAGAIPVFPPKEWFTSPELQTETPLNVDENGRVFGHIATWAQDHISFNYRVSPPRSKSNYQYFHTGVVRTDSGDDVAVGQLTLAGGHAPLEADAYAAVKHYDDTASAVADVHCGEDAFGIWVAGALRPGVTPEQIRTLRASAPSGDWRPIGPRLELVAICQVNVPGFPVARSVVASGQISALVAAGAGDLYRMKNEKISSLSLRVQNLEQQKLMDKRELAIARVQVEKDRRNIELAQSVQKLRDRFAPELTARAEKKAELAVRREEVIKEFRTYREELHPRDRKGRWREVLARLSDFLKDEDTGSAKSEVEKAVQAEDKGDTSRAVEAGEKAKAALVDAVNKAQDETVKGKIGEVISDVDSAIREQRQDRNENTETGPAGQGEQDAVTEALQHGLEQLAKQLLDEISEKVDLKRLAEAEIDRLMRYINDKGLKSPEELAKIIAVILEEA